jgi:hypothetical protein
MRFAATNAGQIGTMSPDETAPSSAKAVLGRMLPMVAAGYSPHHASLTASSSQYAHGDMLLAAIDSARCCSSFRASGGIRAGFARITEQSSGDAIYLPAGGPVNGGSRQSTTLFVFRLP